MSVGNAIHNSVNRAQADYGVSTERIVAQSQQNVPLGNINGVQNSKRAITYSIHLKMMEKKNGSAMPERYSQIVN